MQISTRTGRSGMTNSSQVRRLRINDRRLPGTPGLFELLGDGEEQFFLVGTADQLDVDGEAFRGAAHRQREGGKAGKIEPLTGTHGIAVVVGLTGSVVAVAVFESG